MSRVTVFIPAFNAQEFIADTIESVLNQTFVDWRLIIVDDKSTDDTFRICQEYQQRDSRISAISNSTNLGMVANWNRGVELGRGSEFFVKLDADDVWWPEMLEESIRVLDIFPHVAIVFTRFQNIDAMGQVVPQSAERLPDFARDTSFSCIPLVKLGVDKMLSYSVLRQGLSLIRSQIFSDIGAYRYLLTRETEASSDTEFYFRVGCHFHIHCIDKVLYNYRIHPQSISARDVQKNLQNRKLYEIKMVINNYYFVSGKISAAERRHNMRAAKFQYLLAKNYQARLNRDNFEVFSTYARAFIQYPVRTALHIAKKFVPHRNRKSL